MHYPIRSCVSLLMLASLPLSAIAGPPTINSCTPATATDLTAQSSVTIQYVVGGQFVYSPNCIKVLPNTSITVTSSVGSFSGHPFRPGFVVGAVKTPDPTSPIPAASVGSSTTFTLSRQGLFGYYCDFHAVSTGMNGAILVGSETIFADDLE